LHIRGVEREYFDELQVVDAILEPRRLRYVLVSRPPVPTDSRLRLGAGYLFFEWPHHGGDEVVERWFESPAIEIEGYVARDCPLGHLTTCYFEQDTEERLARLLANIDLGFRLWPDNNGILVFTQHLQKSDLERRIDLPAMNELLASSDI
jgi:hypothetical protein